MATASPWSVGYPSFQSLYQPGTYGGMYGAPGSGTAFETTPIGVQYLEDEPQAAFLRRLTQLGYGGLDRRSQLAQGLYGKVRGGYEAALADNPFMNFASGEGNYLGRVSFA